MTFVDYCKLAYCKDFESKFELEENILEDRDHTKAFLQKELQKSRFDFSSVEIEYQTVAELEGLSFNETKKFWNIIESKLNGFPFINLDYHELHKTFSKISNNNSANIAIKSLNTLIDRTKKIITSNFQGLKNSPQKQMGFLAEIISYLYERDIEKANCIFSKIIPDNPAMPRHGMDLLSIHFSEDEKKDIIYFWEVKSTINNFSDRCKEIVEWFNKDSESHLTMMIEAAKLDWKDKLSKKEFVRASSVLSKFLFAKSNYIYSGSIAFESTNFPTPEKIRKFHEITVPKENKRLMLFNIKNFQCIIDEVYEELCKI